MLEETGARSYDSGMADFDSTKSKKSAKKSDDGKSGQITIRISPIARARLEYIAEREYRSLNLQIEKFLNDALKDWQESSDEGWPQHLRNEAAYKQWQDFRDVGF